MRVILRFSRARASTSPFVSPIRILAIVCQEVVPRSQSRQALLLCEVSRDLFVILSEETFEFRIYRFTLLGDTCSPEGGVGAVPSPTVYPWLSPKRRIEDTSPPRSPMAFQGFRTNLQSPLRIATRCRMEVFLWYCPPFLYCWQREALRRLRRLPDHRRREGVLDAASSPYPSRHGCGTRGLCLRLSGPSLLNSVSLLIFARVRLDVLTIGVLFGRASFSVFGLQKKQLVVSALWKSLMAGCKDGSQ